MSSLKEYLQLLYPNKDIDSIRVNILKLIDSYREKIESGDFSLTEASSLLITYGDILRHPGEPPLHTLKKFLVKHCSGFIDILHLLPFYPYSSDNGFSVIDYLKVDEELGDWSHIRDLSPPFSLAFDGVFNHISAKSRWFEDFLSGEEYAQDYFISPDPKADLSPVTRPRSNSPLNPLPYLHW